MDGDDVGVDVGGGRGDNAGVEDQGEEGEEHVEGKEGGDFLAAFSEYLLLVFGSLASHEKGGGGFVQGLWGGSEIKAILDYGLLPTAVNLLLTCRTIIAVIPNAKMCAKLVAPSKMIVLANSMLRA